MSDLMGYLKRAFAWKRRIRLQLTRDRVMELKGAAIFLIVFHNFFHLSFWKTKENEIDFQAWRFLYFLKRYVHHPDEWVQAFFTYFGHFGVQVFIFLSAYALALSYPAVKSPPRFLYSRFKKLYPVFIGAILVWALVSGYGNWSGPWRMLSKHGVELTQLLTGIHPLPGARYPVVGPWWFIPFIMQFYLLWSLSSILINKASGIVLLLLVCAGVLFNYTITPFVMSAYKVNLLLTPLGHMPEIFLGVYLARYKMRRILFYIFPALALVGLYYSGLNKNVWPLHHFSGLIVFLFLLGTLSQVANRRLRRPFYWLGTISLPLFLVNGFLRQPFLDLYNQKGTWLAHISYGLLFFLVSCLVAFALAKLIYYLEKLLRFVIQTIRGPGGPENPVPPV